MTLPRGKKPVDCKWVFTVKYKANGTVEWYKACLVVKGFTQTYNIDYTETFAPVAKLNTIRVLLSLATNLDWPLHQFDIKNAFLNGELEEEVFMTLHQGFVKRKKKPGYANWRNLYMVSSNLREHGSIDLQRWLRTKDTNRDSRIILCSSNSPTMEGWPS